MRVRTQRRIGAALVMVMCGMFLVMVALFVSLPEGGARRQGGTVPEPTEDARGAVAFCALVLAQSDLPSSMGTAYAQTAEPGHALLTSLAAQWGRDGSAGAREQLAVQCLREHFG